MISRRIAILLLVLSFSFPAMAQNSVASVTDVTPAMVAWARHVASDYDKYFKPEKAADLSQALGMLKQELGAYIKTRKKLADSVFRSNITKGKKDPEGLESLKNRMTTVMESMRNVTDLTNKDIRSEGDKLNEEIYNVLYGSEPRYLSHLEAFLDGNEVTKKDLALDGSICYTRLSECLDIISNLLEKTKKY
ncbi:hypothetical protein [Chitinophaga vietnamensis]|uniref:hypothetical protein n=1 Tax=Chitinophaga vietnamensis TaxID=2593957 RepID=UPI0011788165|nr:hypothetical protein [Chitinophaga vietnamensis]